jgi:hypothetical protein
MPRHRTTRRTLLTAVVLALLSPLGIEPAGAAGPVVKPIVFPVDGPVTYTDTFGACRDGCARRHEGQDLMGKRMLPLLAAVDGVVHRVVFSNTSTGGNSVTIKGADGWTYHYLHVNNDTPGTDDAKATRAQAFPSNIVPGATVKRGQLVAYMGDSGNAESTSPHLHFEIRQPAAPNTYTGVPINAYESLRQATVWSRTSGWELRRTATAGPADETFTYGLLSGDRGLLCDWDGDGADEVVIYRKGTWYLRDGTSAGTTAASLSFGTSTDTPLCGDVDADGADEPALFRSGGYWTIRRGFAADDTVGWTPRYGQEAGDKPVLGDWDGDGDDDIAVFRTGTWYIRSRGTNLGSTVATFTYGTQSGDKPIGGDWDGDGDDDAGVFRGGQWHLRSSAEAAGASVTWFEFGYASGQPVVGHGSGPATPGVGVFRARTA